MEYPFALYSLLGSFPLHKTSSLSLAFSKFCKRQNKGLLSPCSGTDFALCLGVMGTGLKFLPERKLLLHPAGGGGRGNTYETVSGFGPKPSDRAEIGILVSPGCLPSIWSQVVYFVPQWLLDFPPLAATLGLSLPPCSLRLQQLLRLLLVSSAAASQPPPSPHAPPPYHLCSHT